jgi:hypothetical protein
MFLQNTEKDRVIILNGMKWAVDWSGETDGLFSVVLSTEFSGATSDRVYVYKDIPATSGLRCTPSPVYSPRPAAPCLSGAGAPESRPLTPSSPPRSLRAPRPLVCGPRPGLFFSLSPFLCVSVLKEHE